MAVDWQTSAANPEMKEQDPGKPPMTFEEIYRAYGKKILNLAFRFTGSEEAARDLTQDIFLKVYHKMDSFRGDSQVYTWLYRVATNHILNYLKREKRLRWLNLMEKPLSEALQENRIESDYLESRGVVRPDQKLEKREREKLIQGLIQKLPVKQRTPLILHRYEGLSYQEIAEVMGISLSAVETRIHRAKKQLIEYLQPWLEEI